MGIFHIVSTCVLLIIIAGIMTRKNQKLHIPLMTAAFVIDLTSVLVIEIQRQAVEKVVGSSTHPLLIFHAIISIMVLVLYVLMMTSGKKLQKFIAEIKPLELVTLARRSHVTYSAVFIILRLTNYVTSFMIK
jgi:hypothetical protein